MFFLRRLFFFYIFFLLLIPILTSATDYYVDGTNGQWNNDGLTPETAWSSIYLAKINLQPGDTVYIREGIYTRYDERIIPSNSGTPGNYITYTNYQNETVILRGNDDRRFNGAFWLTNKNYIKIDGLIFDGVSGGQTWGDYKYLKEFGRIINSSYIIIQNCKMSYAEGWFGILIDKDSHHNKIINNTMHHLGYPEPPADDDYGNTIGVFGDYNLIEGNNISYGGHNLVEITAGKHNIVRNNYLHSHNGRCIGINNVYEEETDRYNVVENNIISYSSLLNNCGMQSEQIYAIIRFNEFYNNWGNGLYIYNTQGTGVDKGSYTKIYNNVIYNNGHLAEGPKSHVFHNGLALFDWSGGSREFENISIKNNIFYKNNKSGILFYDTPMENHIVENNLESIDPLFIDEAKYDFHLQNNSPCIDVGTFLTVTTSAGTGIKIPVGDASYFIDGFGIVEGDVIQLEGQSITARIVSIDYDNNVLTVDRSLNWTSGLGVSLSYSGSAPDIGVYEFDSGETPSLPEPILGDLNNDGVVDILDLTIVANNFGLTSGFDQRADTDNDGEVDIFDIVFVASRFT